MQSPPLHRRSEPQVPHSPPHPSGPHRRDPQSGRQIAPQVRGTVPAGSSPFPPQSYPRKASCWTHPQESWGAGFLEQSLQ